MDRNKNYLLRSFIITLLIVIMLAGMFFLPRITLFDKTLRRVDILGDVLQKDSLGNVIAETKMDSMLLASSVIVAKSSCTWKTSCTSL